MAEFDFEERLAFSTGTQAATCKETIMRMIHGCVRVTRQPPEIDKTGVDYKAFLSGGGQVWIDHKARSPCSRFWRIDPDTSEPIPELALETHSVMASDRGCSKPGWTLDDAKATHYTLHTFDPADTRRCWLLPFQLLRLATGSNLSDWKSRFKTAVQTSRRGKLFWRSCCVFVPVPVVVKAIMRAIAFQINPT